MSIAPSLTYIYLPNRLDMFTLYPNSEFCMSHLWVGCEWNCTSLVSKNLKYWYTFQLWRKTRGVLGEGRSVLRTILFSHFLFTEIGPQIQLCNFLIHVVPRSADPWPSAYYLFVQVGNNLIFTINFVTLSSSYPAQLQVCSSVPRQGPVW